MPGRSPHGLCPHHEELLDFLLLVLPNIKSEPAQSKSGLVLPGQPGYVVPKEVIRSAVEKRRGG